MHKVLTALGNGGAFKTALQPFVREETSYILSSISAEKNDWCEENNNTVTTGFNNPMFHKRWILLHVWNSAAKKNNQTK